MYEEDVNVRNHFLRTRGDSFKQVLIPIIIVVLFLLSFKIVTTVAGTSTPLVVVSGNSMLPTLYHGDIVIIYKPDPWHIKEGDIIVYRSTRGELVIHRVVRVAENSPSNKCQPVCYITKGDNNRLEDPWIGLQPQSGVSYSDVLGEVLTIKIRLGYFNVDAPLRIPYLGLLSFILKR